ncbi:DUF771 domain-containing protein [Priestia flexa]|uniref:DUF771 domain-containing protein n=1 Tax=Priestia flexa TaxID=86664 RepID=UPI002490371C|nr:DUF771 domain-containing protein [Priestia flexa]
MTTLLQDAGLQQQSLSVNLTIPIPSDSVIISKVELQELKKQQLSGVYWTMKDLELRINRKHEWIKDEGEIKEIWFYIVLVSLQANYNLALYLAMTTN